MTVFYHYGIFLTLVKSTDSSLLILRMLFRDAYDSEYVTHIESAELIQQEYPYFKFWAALFLYVVILTIL